MGSLFHNFERGNLAALPESKDCAVQKKQACSSSVKQQEKPWSLSYISSGFKPQTYSFYNEPSSNAAPSWEVNQSWPMFHARLELIWATGSSAPSTIELQMRTGKMEAAREAAQSMDSVRLGENLTQYTANLLVTQVTSTGTVTSIRSSLSTSMALYDIIQYHCILSICKSSINGYVSIAMLNYSKPQKDLEEVIGRYLSVILVILLFHQFVGENYTVPIPVNHLKIRHRFFTTATKRNRGCVPSEALSELLGMPTAESEMLRDDGNVDFSSRTMGRNCS